MTELKEVNQLSVNELEEIDADASRRSRITNSNDHQSTPGVDARPGAGGSASAGPHFSTLLGNGSVPTAQMGTGGFYLNPPSTLPSCLTPNSFTGSGYFEKYLQQFNFAAMLLGWHSSRHDNRPQYFALRLRDNALHFWNHIVTPPRKRFWTPCRRFQTKLRNKCGLFESTIKSCETATKSRHSNFPLCYSNFGAPSIPGPSTFDRPNRPYQFQWGIAKFYPQMGTEKKEAIDSRWSPDSGQWIRLLSSFGAPE